MSRLDDGTMEVKGEIWVAAYERNWYALGSKVLKCLEGGGGC